MTNSSQKVVPLKVMTILGTRPEIIRLASVMRRLDEICTHIMVHTGQNYDYELSQAFFNDFGLRKPDHYLGIDTTSLGSAIGGIIIQSEKILKVEKPNAVLILGDTNSAISAYIARRMKIPVYHMEAGNRSYDRNVPEETNRVLVDHIADFNLVYTEHARRNLLSEGLPARRIYVVGSPMRELLESQLDGIRQADILSRLGLTPQSYFLVSIHREENVDNPINLNRIVAALSLVAKRYDMPVIVSTHPRTRKRLQALDISKVDARIKWLKPFGYHDYIHLQIQARCVISDSGTIAEEASILGFPAVTPRLSIERPEALDSGDIVICGNATDSILSAVHMQITGYRRCEPFTVSNLAPVDYLAANVSERVVRLLVGTARLSNQWDGIVECN